MSQHHDVEMQELRPPKKGHHILSANARREQEESPREGDDEIDLTKEGPWSLEEEAERVQVMASRIGGYQQLHTILLHSNAKTIDDVVRVANEGKEVVASDSSFGRLIDDGHIGVVTKEGVTTLVGPGRYRLWHPRTEWHGRPLRLADGVVRVGPITVFRVPNGQYAKVFKGNEPYLVSPDNGGLYVVNNPAFRLDGFVRIDDQHIQHGTIHIVRVPRGKYACVTQNNIPSLLPPGVHVFRTNDFNLVKFASLSDSHIHFETITRFFVPEGSIGLAWRDSTPVFFQDRGVYLVDSPMFRFVQSKPFETPCIELGSQKIVTVKEGLVGVSHNRGKLQILPPGRHIIEDEQHIFDEFLSTQQMSLGLTKSEGPPPAGYGNEGLMECESRELVKIGIQASVFYNIKDPALAVVKIGDRVQIEKFINDTATAVITTIIRTTSLAEIAQSGKGDKTKERVERLKNQQNPHSPTEERNDEEEEDFAPNLPFFDRMHADFISRLQENFLREYGIYMLNVRIGDFKVLDRDIAQSIANHAATTAATQAKLANLEGNRQIDLVNKDSDARIEKIQAEVDAHKMTTTSKAQATSTRENAQAKADAMKIEAAARMETVKLDKDTQARSEKIQAEVDAHKMTTSSSAQATTRREQAQANADAMRIEAAARMEAMKLEAEAKAQSIRVIAEAEAEATRVKAAAEAERAQKLGETAFGREVTLAEVQANMVRESLHGVEKMVYMPNEMSGNPFALFSRDQMALGNVPTTSSGGSGRK